MSVLHISEKIKADFFFLTKAWESYWRRMELKNWLKKIRRGGKKTKGLLDPSNASWAAGIYMSVVRCLVSDIILSDIILSSLVWSCILLSFASALLSLYF